MAPPVGLLVFDGDCGFCTTAANWFSRHAITTADIASWQSLDLATVGLTEAEVSSAVYWVEDGRSHRGADACVKALQTCRGPWRLLGRVAAIPPLIWLARLAYPIVAKNRYRLPGSTDACRIDQRPGRRR